MNSTPISSTKALTIFLGLRLTRLRNIWVPAKKKKEGASRLAVAQKGKNRGLIIVVGIFLAGCIAVFNFQSLQLFKMQYPSHFSEAFALSFGMLSICFGLANFASNELRTNDSDLEWLATLPASWTVLMFSKVFARGLLTFLSALLFINLSCGAFFSGVSWWISLIAAAFVTILLQLLLGLWQISFEYFLRLRFSVGTLKNIQAVMALVGAGPVFMAINPNNGLIPRLLKHSESPQFFFVREILPVALAQSVIDISSLTWLRALSILLQCLVLFCGGIAALRFVLRKGIIGSSVQESSRDSAKAPSPKREFSFLLRFSPIIRREFVLLRRDRSMLVQTFLMPIGIAAFQIYQAIYGKGENAWGAGAISCMLFSCLALMLASSCFQIVNSEGQALWILKSSPVELDRAFNSKRRMWAIIVSAMAFFALAFLHAKALIPSTPLQFLKDALILVGVQIYSYIALCLGIFNSSPLSDDVSKTIKPSALYFFLGLVTFFFGVLLQDSYWSISVLVFLLGAFAYAFWIEAKIYLPFILDPVASPKAQVGLAHGLFGTVLFFLFQITFALIRPEYLEDNSMGILWSYGLAGVSVFVCMRSYFAWRKIRDLPRFFGENPTLNLFVGLAIGCALAGFAWVYCRYLLPLFGFSLAEISAKPVKIPSGFGLPTGIVIVLTLMAPIAEEFLFRGLVFRGMKRSLSFPIAAIGSALIFGVVHSPYAFVPVALMGFVSAVVYQRTQNLMASIALHACYNASVLLLAV